MNTNSFIISNHPTSCSFNGIGFNMNIKGNFNVNGNAGNYNGNANIVNNMIKKSEKNIILKMSDEMKG